MTQEPSPHRLTLPGVISLLMLVYGGAIDVFAVESMVDGEAGGIVTFLIGTFVVILGTLSDRDRHRDYVAEARREMEEESRENAS